MTDLNSLTLADIEALAERLGAAARTIREAQAMLHGSPVRITPSDHGYIEPLSRVALAPVVNFSPTEQAERAKLLQQFKPEDVEAMERP